MVDTAPLRLPCLSLPLNALALALLVAAGFHDTSFLSGTGLAHMHQHHIL